MSTPYVVPNILTSSPLGVNWGSIPAPQSSTALQLSEQMRICKRSTAIIDAFCNQPLRATLDTETLIGPGTWRLSVTDAGTARFLVSRWPVIEPIVALASPTYQIPPSWTVIPGSSLMVSEDVDGALTGAILPGSGPLFPGTSAAQAFEVEIAPGAVSWCYGRMNTRIALTYLNGWSHTSLTAACSVGATTLSVDDVTAFTGQDVTIYDEPYEEGINIASVTATNPITLPISGIVVPIGPGTLTLTSPTEYAHPMGTMVSTMSPSVQWAACLLGAAQATTRGVTAVSVQSLRGTTSSGAGGKAADWIAQARELIEAYKRTL